MTDRKEVMTWLKICGMGDCSECCPYKNGEVCASACYEQLMMDALSLLKDYEQEINRLKHHVDCDAAEKLPSGCVGYGRGFNDDEPCETCKACKKIQRLRRRIKAVKWE